MGSKFPPNKIKQRNFLDKKEEMSELQQLKNSQEQNSETWIFNGQTCLTFETQKFQAFS